MRRIRDPRVTFPTLPLVMIMQILDYLTIPEICSAAPTNKQMAAALDNPGRNQSQFFAGIIKKLRADREGFDQRLIARNISFDRTTDWLEPCSLPKDAGPRFYQWVKNCEATDGFTLMGVINSLVCDFFRNGLVPAPEAKDETQLQRLSRYVGYGYLYLRHEKTSVFNNLISLVSHFSIEHNLNRSNLDLCVTFINLFNFDPVLKYFVLDRIMYEVAEFVSDEKTLAFFERFINLETEEFQKMGSSIPREKYIKENRASRYTSVLQALMKSNFLNDAAIKAIELVLQNGADPNYSAPSRFRNRPQDNSCLGLTLRGSFHPIYTPQLLELFCRFNANVTEAHIVAATSLGCADSLTGTPPSRKCIVM